jgi:hypothetical protein
VNIAAKFDPAGNQTNTLFGQLGTAANPPYMQFAARFDF